MLNTRVEAHISTDSPRIATFRILDHVPNVDVALPHHNKLHSPSDLVAGVMHHPIDARNYEVHTLLGTEPTAKANNDDIGILMKAELLLQRRFTLCLTALKICDGVICREVRVGGRAPLVRNAIQDPGCSHELALR